MAISKHSASSSGASLPAPSELTDKPFFRIGEVARAVGVEPHVLRYWEREFRGIRPQKSARGQRVYSKRDLDLLVQVRELLYAQGFTIAGAKKKLSRSGKALAAEPETAVAAVGQPLASAVVVGKTQARTSTRTGAEDVSAISPAELRSSLLSLRQEFEDFLTELR